MEDQYVYTESRVQESYQHLSVDDLIKLANDIWKDIKSHPKFNDDSASDELTNEFFTKYKDFSYSFPIVIRWMIQLRVYSSKSFKKYLLKYKESNITSRKDFAILQSEYLVFLYKENKRYDQNNVNLYRDFVIKQLLEEEEEQIKIEKEFREELNNVNNEKRREAYEYFKNIRSLT
jgi:hypothetical protein